MPRTTVRTNPHLLVCNGPPKPSRIGRQGKEWASVEPQPLWTDPRRANVILRIADITDKMAALLPPVVEDLVELAALVYAADQACRRVRGKSFEYGTVWRRRFRFEVAVREPDFWSRPAVRDVLQEGLGFLSDDDYEFAFGRYADPPRLSEFLECIKDQPPPPPPDRVMLFSAGLDSLTGMAEEVFVHRRRVALVSHKPVDHLGARQHDLVAEVRRRARAIDAALMPQHYAVKANKVGELTADNTQRSRSFLYASMAAAVAHLFGLDRIYFYENGVVSVNLPLCGQEVGGRATRTTHPQTLHHLARLYSLVFEREFRVENEYLWDTKEDVLRRLLTSRHADLARQSFSCIHTRRLTQKAPHCGLCSQCLSRWVASLGAEYGENDPAGGYEVQVLTGPRQREEERTLAERFVGAARRVEQMPSADQFLLTFPELTRVLPYVGLPEGDAVAKLFDLHHRHAEQVHRALRRPMHEYLDDLYAHHLPDTCALSFAFNPKQFTGATEPAKAEPHGNAEPFVPTALQRAILEKLARCAMRSRPLAQRLNVDQPRLFKPGGIKELLDLDRVRKHSRLGYYRPDAPPAELAGRRKAG